MAIVKDFGVLAGQDLGDLEFVANEDLSGSQYCAVSAVANATGKMLVGLPASAGAQVTGVLQNAPISGGRAVVRVSGISRLNTSGIISGGANVQSDGAGKVLTAASGDYIVGVAINAAVASGDEITVLVNGLTGAIA